jgi:sugar phosphate isomerase/epimerase
LRAAVDRVGKSESEGGVKMRLATVLFLFAAAAATAQVKDYPIGRCVRVVGVTAPEDAAKAGFEYVELALQDMLPLNDAEFAQQVQRIKGLGIPAISGYGFLPADLRVVGPDVDDRKVDEAVRFGLDRAQKLGLKMVVYGNLLTRGRSVPEGFAKSVAWKQLTAFGKRAAAEAGRRGITVLVEPMPARGGVLVNTIAEGVALVRAVGDDHLRLLVDYGYFTESGESLAALREAAKFVRQVEIQNPKGRVYPRTADESDYTSFMRALKAGGYRGGFSIHGAPTDFWVDAPRAIAMLRRVLAQN